MSTQPRKKITISILIPFLVFTLFFSIMIWQKYRLSHEIAGIPAGSNAGSSRNVTLFFAEEGTRLVREARMIEPCDNEADCLKSILDELLNGSVGEFEEALPEGTVVNTVRIEYNQGTIDLNLAFADAMPSGSSAEMLAVYSIVDTIVINFPHIQKVKINIEGNPAATLRHLDLSDPLEADFTLEQTRSPESEQPSAKPKNN